MESDSINLETYLTFLGLDEFKVNRPEPNLDTLSKIVEKHATKIHYQNVALQLKYISGEPIVKEDLLISTIQNKLIDKKEGGMCYDINFLMEAALVALGFNVQLVSAFPMVLIPGKLPEHLALVVQIESSYYIVDPGFGINKLRAPLKFDFETTQETVVFGYEKYQVVVEPTCYHVDLITDGKVLKMFYFLREGSAPIFSKKEKIILEYVTFMNSEEESVVRDLALFMGGATSDGRLALWYDKKENSGWTFKLENYLPTFRKIYFKDFEEFQKAAKEALNVDVPSELQKVSKRPKA